MVGNAHPTSFICVPGVADLRMQGSSVAAMGRSYNTRCRQTACCDHAASFERIHDPVPALGGFETDVGAGHARDCMASVFGGAFRALVTILG
jgi:hypothetical protein